MAGAGIEVRYDKQAFQSLVQALSNASQPDLQSVSEFMGNELDAISNQAFEDEADPVTGTKWAPLKQPRSNGSTDHLLQDKSILYPSRTHIDTPEGTTYGSNLVYARIHQEGGRTKAHDIQAVNQKSLRFNGRFAKKVRHPGSTIPARPYMGVPPDFDRRILTDPAVLRLLGIVL